MIIADYQSNINTSNSIQTKLKKTSKQLSFFRLLSFLCILFSIYIAYQTNLVYLYVVSLLLFILFIGLVKRHDKVNQKLAYQKSLCTVLNHYISRFDSSWKHINNANEAVTQIDATSKDLDVLGQHSLYQYICCANTVHGQEALINKLTIQNPNKDTILSQQEAVKELANLSELSIEIETLSQLIPVKNRKLNVIESFVELSKESQSLSSRFLSYIKWMIPGIAFLSLLLSFFNFEPNATSTIAYFLFVFQLVFTFFHLNKHARIFRPISAFCENIEAYQLILEQIEHATFSSEYLIALQAKVSEKNSASFAIHSLRKLNDAIKFRLNLVAYIFLNMLFMWEFHCVDHFLVWSKQYNTSILTWLEVIGEFEALISLASLCQVKEETCFPSIHDNKNTFISFQNLNHPLIQEKDAIGNDFNLSSTCIITGSNMSGKTTFLRTIGINLILAYAGGPVLARTFDASIMKIFTSIRIEDSVDKGISTFYAELLRIKEMVLYAKQELPMISFIDEIFNGTNSKDRILGAKETIRRLQNSCSLTLVSTHDLELCSLSIENKYYLNYHFSEYYKDNKIFFDYKLKEGISQTTNAQYLLKMVGII